MFFFLETLPKNSKNLKCLLKRHILNNFFHSFFDFQNPHFEALSYPTCQAYMEKKTTLYLCLVFQPHFFKNFLKIFIYFLKTSLSNRMINMDSKRYEIDVTQTKIEMIYILKLGSTCKYYFF